MIYRCWLNLFKTFDKISIKIPLLPSQHVEFERRVEKFPYQLFEVFELFLPTQEFIRNNGYVDVAQPLTFSLDYRARDISASIASLPRVFRSTSFFFHKLPSEAP
jgi:hypothetical protein